MNSYRDLVVWQKAMDLVDALYALTRCFPDDERYALATQLRRAVVSVPSNIAEGYGRQHRKDYIRFLCIANGSLKEVETQPIIAGRQQFIDKEIAAPAWTLAQETGKLLNALIKSLA